MGREKAFVALALLYLVEWSVARTTGFAATSILPASVYFDLVVVAPVAFYVFYLRPNGRPLVQVAPVLAFSAVVASTFVRGRADLRWLAAVGGALTESAVILLLVARLRRGMKETRGAEGDLVERVRAIEDPVVRTVGAEIVMLRYAFARLRARQLATNEWSYHLNTGLGGLLFGFGFVSVVEASVVHLLLAPRFPRFAWSLLALTVYSTLFLFAVYRAAQLRPIRLEKDRLLVRTSLFWSVTVPLERIARIQPTDDVPTGKEVLRARVGTEVNVDLVLSSPVVAHGLFGRTKLVTRIALYVDDPTSFVKALSVDVAAL